MTTVNVTANGQIFDIDPSTGPHTIVAPANPYDGYKFHLTAKVLNSTSVTVDGNGKTIYTFYAGSQASLTFPMHGNFTTLSFNAGDDRWRVNDTPLVPQWRGPWKAGTYPPYSMVRRDFQDSYLWISNKTTSLDPGPIGDNTPGFLVPDAPSWVPGSQTAAPSYSGLDFTASGSEIARMTGVRIWRPEIGVNTHYSFFLYDITDPLSAPILARFDFPAGAGSVGWIEVDIKDLLIVPPQKLRAILVCVKTTGADTPVGPATGWQYKAGEAAGDLSKGEMSRNGAYTQLYIANRETGGSSPIDFSLFTNGDEITITESGISSRYDTYDVISNDGSSGTGDDEVWTFTVVRTDNGSAVRDGRDVQISGIVRGALDNAPYVELANYWTDFNTDPDWTAKGWQDNTYDAASHADPTLTDNAYGLDLKLALLEVTADWDFMALSQF